MPQSNITTPQLNNNDDFVRVVTWHVPLGARVGRGQILVTLETVKASMDVEAEVEGFLRWTAAAADAMTPVGAVLAILTDIADEPFEVVLEKEKTQLQGVTGSGDTSMPLQERRRVTAKARARAKQLNIDVDRLEAAAGETITEQVIEAFARQAAASQGPDDSSGRVAKKSVHPETLLETAGAGLAAIIIGDGAHARYMLDTIGRSGVFRVAGCTSATRERGDTVAGMTVLGSDDDLPALFASGFRLAFIGIGSSRETTRSNEGRRRVYERLKEIGFFLPVIVDPHASLSPSAKVDEGSVVGARTVVSAYAEIGRNCLINVGAIVCHDCIIEDHVHVTPGAVLAGGVFVGAGSTIGMAASVLDGTRIGRNCLVPNGYRVIKNLPDGTVAPSI